MLLYIFVIAAEFYRLMNPERIFMSRILETTIPYVLFGVVIGVQNENIYIISILSFGALYYAHNIVFRIENSPIRSLINRTSFVKLSCVTISYFIYVCQTLIK